ncbi:hypothetical protein [Hymenobacter crusticola]|uniref:Uncharacterized protein n=1 Tax=Hymenobacter crusticola TaxID=1770526 RepID=A0A243WG92_9BACT|nr:hypothetical protein [Hymenobacter crusticola]OUJ74527.1 hypothetical protein BXP70_07020 [Hymenobacter crusticola]
MNRPLPLSTTKILFWALALALPLQGCNALFGKEVSRLPVNVVSTAGHEVVREATLKLQKDDEVSLWSEMDMAYDGEAPLRFQLLILKNGAAFQELEINPTDKHITVGELKTSINGRINWSFSGKNGEITVPENANYTFKARLVAANNPTLQIKKAELVLKK